MLRVVVVLAWLIPGFAFAQVDARTRRRRASHAHDGRERRGGRGSHAGRAERVRRHSGDRPILEADPKTDWSKVDIEALRRHLIDMNNVTLYADVRSEPVEGGMRFTVTGAGAVKDRSAGWSARTRRR